MQVRSKYYASDDRIEIHGSEGIIWVNRCSGQLLDEPSVVLYRDGETRAFHDLATDWAESFRLGGIDFVDALREGRPPAQTPEDARRTLAFALAAARSASEGREVDLSKLLGPEAYTRDARTGTAWRASTEERRAHPDALLRGPGWLAGSSRRSK